MIEKLNYVLFRVIFCLVPAAVVLMFLVMLDMYFQLSLGRYFILIISIVIFALGWHVTRCVPERGEK